MSMGTGAKLEALVRRSLKAQGLDRTIKQMGPRFAGRVGPRGRAKGRLVGKGVLDFTGHFQGRHVSFDAKSTAGGTLPFGERGIRKHQAIICRNAHEDGALAFFLVEATGIEGGPRYFALTWDVLADWYRRWQRPKPGEKAVASIPLSVVVANCREVKVVRRVLDLEEVLDALLKTKEENQSVAAH